MECRACELQMERILCDLPSAWRKQIVEAVCTHIVCKGLPCDKVAECLSDEMSGLDYKCLVGSQAQWDALSASGKIQTIIDKVCSLFDGLTLDTLDTFSINLTGLGDSSSPLKADVIISPTAGNLTTVVNNGVLTQLTTGNTATVTLAGAGTQSSPLTATATVDIPDNTFTLNTENTTSIVLGGNGDTTPLNAAVIIDPEPANLTQVTANGVLTLDQETVDVTKGLTQHLVFEIPVMDQLTFDYNGTRSGTKVGIAGGLGILGGTSYATSYANPNPDVNIFWGDTATYEHTFDNEAGSGNSLTHDYLALKAYTNEAYIKGYGSNHLTKLINSDSNVMPSGLRAIRGGEFIDEIHYSMGLLGTTGIYDLKGFYNLRRLQFDVYFGDSYASGAGNTGITFKNLEDLHRIEMFSITGVNEVRTDGPIIFTSNVINSIGLIGATVREGLIAMNKTPALNVLLSQSSTEELNLYGSNLSAVNLSNSGHVNGNRYINRIALKMKDTPYVADAGAFDFTGFKNLRIAQVNGRLPDTETYVTMPSKILFPNFSTQKFEYIDMDQDIVKDEAFISFNNNGLENGFVTFNYASQARSFGNNYEEDYYNPTWAPLNGWGASLGVAYSGGVVTAIAASSDNAGYGYNTIPIVTTTGAGTGLVTNGLMTLSNTSILNGGTGYTTGQIINMSGGTFNTPVQIQIQSQSGGVANQVYILNGGEYSALPGSNTLTHAGGLIISTASMWSYKRANITNGGTGYGATTRFFLEVTSGGGTGTGTASAAAKAAIEGLHSKGWQLKW